MLVIAIVATAAMSSVSMANGVCIHQSSEISVSNKIVIGGPDGVTSITEENQTRTETINGKSHTIKRRVVKENGKIILDEEISSKD